MDLDEMDWEEKPSIETTYIPLAKAAEMLGTDELMLLISGAELRISLYWLLNEHVPVECVGISCPELRGQKKKMYCMFAPLGAGSVASIIQGREVEIYLFDDGEDSWILDKVAQPKLFPSNRGLVFVKLEDIQSIISDGLLPDENTVVDVKERVPAMRESTVLATVAALLANIPGGKTPSGKDLERAADSVGVSVSDDSILKVIRAAKAMGKFPD